MYSKESIVIDLKTNLNCSFFEYNDNDYNSILVVQVDGEIRYGSQGKDDSEYIYLEILRYLGYIKPFGLLLDFRNLKYEFGDTIIRILEIGTQIDFYKCKEELPLTLVVSGKNVYLNKV